ncbi:hypothetical protein BHO_0900071 (plasmid) [Borrelia hermsii YBT]|uniref:Uncharacterized protein n=1 Tax=Borrelia hermsii YBT TaxID=1313295 RepID=W5T257_BORHE|nr:hypothetical protein BHO_0900071 [Borrelia hermsii YBT]
MAKEGKFSNDAVLQRKQLVGYRWSINWWGCKG